MNTARLKKLIGRYLRGRASKTEKYVVDRWYESLIEYPDAVPGANDPQRLQSLKQRIIGRVSAHGTSLAWHRRPWPRLVAATFILCCFSWLLALYFQDNPSGTAPQPVYHTVQTGIRQVKRLVLPDSTVIHLNANSTIRIPKSFEPDKREVFLDEGEAYFDVARDEQRPFSVQTDPLQIRVLGTSFNVSAYRQLEYVNVVVNSGMVQLADKHHALAMLSANEQLTYHRETARFDLHRKVSPNDNSSWRNGVSVLRQASFEELVLVMYNSYGVSLESADESIINTSYNFTVRSTRTLEQTMRQLSEMIQKKYRKEGERIIIY